MKVLSLPSLVSQFHIEHLKSPETLQQSSIPVFPSSPTANEPSIHRNTQSTIALRHSVSHLELTRSVFKFFNLIIDKRGQWCRLELRLGSFTTSRAQLMPSSLPSLWFLRVFQCSFHASQTKAGRKCTPCARRLKSPATSISAVEHHKLTQPTSKTSRSRATLQHFTVEPTSSEFFLQLPRLQSPAMSSSRSRATLQTSHGSQGIQAITLVQLIFADTPRQLAALAVYQSLRSR